MDRKIAIIGGGAAGMMAALQAAEAGSARTFMKEMTEWGKNCLPQGMADAIFPTGI